MDNSLQPFRQALMQLQGQLSLPELIAILWVAELPGLSVNDLSEKMGVPQQTASRYVSILTGRYTAASSDDEKHKPRLEQRINEADPRSRALYLTDAGKALINKAVQNLRRNAS